MGPVQSVWEGYAVDPQVRLKGSSGGVGTALAQYFKSIEQPVVAVGQSEKSPFENETLGSDQIHKMSGSRYVPSSPAEKLSSVEKGGLLIGKPCDIAGAKQLHRLTGKVRTDSFVTVSIFCAGVPSIAGNKQLVEREGLKVDDVVSLKFRGDGWPGNWHAQTNSGTSRELTYQESWGFIQAHRQWRCYICPDHTGEFADISIGDAWHRQVEGAGRSLIVVRSALGAQILDDAISKGFVFAERVENACLPASQPELIRTRRLLQGRLLAMKLLGLRVPNFVNMGLKRPEISLTHIKNVASTVRRIFRKRLYRAESTQDSRQKAECKS